MKRFLGRLSLVVGVILAACIVFLVRAIPAEIASTLSNRLGVRVSVGPFVPGIWGWSVRDLVVSNVPGGKLSTALAVDVISVRASPVSYVETPIVIDAVELRDVYIGIEFDTIKGASGNWTRMMSAHPGASSPRSGRPILIRKLTLTNVQADVYFRDKGVLRQLPVIPSMELTDISSEGGSSLDQITSSVLGKMLKSVFEQENLKNMLQEMLSPDKFLNPGGSGGGIFRLF